MCVSSPVYPVIIGNVRGACQMKADNQGVQQRKDCLQRLKEEASPDQEE